MMTSFQISAARALIIIYVRVITCNELYDVNMVRDLLDHFRISWVVIQTCEKTDYPIVNLLNEIKNSTIVYGNIFEWNDFSKSADFVMRENSRAMVLLTCWSCPMECLFSINKMPELMLRFTWLLMRRENTSFNLNHVNIPINSIFMVIERSSPHLYIINEVYRIAADTDLIYAQYGTWSSQTGLNCNTISWEERRSNFFGENITTLMEADDSVNPLKGIYKHFAPIYTDIAKRLNFTIKKETNPEEYHEVSIILEWADAIKDMSAFAPIYSLRQSIFFKDIGVGIQLDGYITPFQTVVWQAVLFVVILAGILSYVAANVYARMNRNRKLPRRIDFYLYKSFYILCQKNEVGENYAAHRIITLSQWLLSIFLLSCYSAIFISFISVEIPKPPFTTLDELLDKKGYNIVTSKYISHSTLSFLETSGDPKLRKLYKYHFDPVKNAVEHVPSAFCKNQHYVFITSDIHITMMRSMAEFAFCPISRHHIRLYLRHLTWFSQKDSSHRRILQIYITKMSMAGVMQSHFVRKNTFKDIPEPSDFKEITMEDTTMLFIILSSGLLLSISIFLLEIASRRFKIFK